MPTWLPHCISWEYSRARGCTFAFAVVAVFGIVLGSGAVGGAAEGRKPNLIVILADDLGYGDLGCFGQKKLKTPRLDAMAKEGMRFTQFYAGSAVCAPSRAAMLIGKHTGRSPIRGNSSAALYLNAGQPTVASLLKAAGYKTACIGKWGVGTPDNLTNPNDLGFDHFFGYVNMWHAHNPYPEFLIRNGKVESLRNEVGAAWKKWQDPKLLQGGKGVAVKRVDYAPDLLVDDALRFIREQRKEPFFLLLSLVTPHANNEAGAEGMEVPDLGEFANADWLAPEKAFAAMLRNLDRDTGRILDLLKELKIDRDTLVLFTSDNGPHQEGGHDADFFDSNGPLRGIKRDGLEGGIRVPMIAWRPGFVVSGGENRQQWWIGDLMATAAELSGVMPPTGLDSDSLVAALKGESGDDLWRRRSPLYWECYERGGWQVVRFGKWKAIRRPIFTGEIELYDMSNDIGEKTNYAKRRPDLTNHARNLLNKHHQPDPNWK
jgi:arylsulfatase A-like enzyme